MKKVNILILLIGCIVITSCISQNDTINQRKEHELKGEVRSLKISEYTAIEKFGEIIKDSLRYSQILYFSPKGLIDSLVYYKDDFQKLGTGVYRWDFSNNTCTINPDSTFYQVLQYNDQFNRLLSQISYNNDSISGKQIRNYNESLQLIDLIVYKENGDVWWREKDHEYNEKGELMHYNEYNEKGELEEQYTYRYDDNGILIGMKKETDWSKSKYTYEYNSENLLSREIWEYKSKSKYSNYSSTNITEYTYQLDDKGNYLVKTKKSYDKDDSNNNIVYEYTEREITYY